MCHFLTCLGQDNQTVVDVPLQHRMPIIAGDVSLASICLR
jgi:hypothetical protein